MRAFSAHRRGTEAQAGEAAVAYLLGLYLGGRHSLCSQPLARSYRFLGDGRLELDTNPVDSAIRPVALTRKNTLFAGHGSEPRTCATRLHIATYSSATSIPSRNIAEFLRAVLDGHPQTASKISCPGTSPKREAPTHRRTVSAYRERGQRFLNRFSCPHPLFFRRKRPKLASFSRQGKHPEIGTKESEIVHYTPPTLID